MPPQPAQHSATPPADAAPRGTGTEVAQLPLPLRPPGAGDFDSFIDDGNTAVVAALHHWAADPTAGNILLHGEAGSGKSHLLHAACKAARETGAGVAFVALDMGDLEPAVLDALEARDAVVIDALQAVAGEPAWELALFNLYNALLLAGGRLLLAARAPAPGLGLGLPDLASRLCACTTYAVRPLDDAGRAHLLRSAAAARGMRLDDATLAYILKYSQRDTAALLSLLEDLDQTSLARRRAPNRRLVGELLQRPRGHRRPDADDPFRLTERGRKAGAAAAGLLQGRALRDNSPLEPPPTNGPPNQTPDRAHGADDRQLRLLHLQPGAVPG